MAGGTTLGKAYVQIMPSAEGIQGRLAGLFRGPAGQEGEQSGANFSGSFVSAAKKLVAGAAIGKFFADSIRSGAALEQSLGGIETLFKGSADKVKAYAKDSFRTTQLSANDYMETVTSFSASMIQSLGGDTEKAAEMSNRAVVDMADNANKMGTNMRDIQNAYQGFAKQNYTMLDNLKLGYGGTQAEMKRLISDASKMTKEQKDLNLTVKDGDMSFANITAAISVMQKHLGIAGTSSKEAATTLSGSFNMMKAAWEDFKGNLAIGGDVNGSLMNLVTSASTFIFNNLVPAIGRIILAIPSVLGTFITQAIPMIYNEIKKQILNIGKMIDGSDSGQWQATAKKAINDFITGLQTNAPIIIQEVGQDLINLVAFIMDHAPDFLLAASELAIQLGVGIIQSLPSIVGSLGSVLVQLAASIIAHGPSFLAGGAQLIGQMMSGIMQMNGALLGAIGSIVGSMASRFVSTDWGTVGHNIVNGIANGISAAADQVWEALKAICKKAIGNVKKFFGIKSPSRLMADEVGKYLPSGIGVGVTANADSLYSSIDSIVNQAMALATNGVNTIVSSPVVQTTQTSVTGGSMEDVIALLNRIADKDPNIYMDDTKVTKKVTQKVTEMVGNLNAFQGV